MLGPLGALPGFWYDPERKKYFPGVKPEPTESIEVEQTLGIRQDKVEAGPSRVIRPVDSRVVGRTRATTEVLRRAQTRSAQMAVRKSASLQPNFVDSDPRVNALACTSDTLFVGTNSGCLSSLTRGRGCAYDQDTFLSSSIVDIHVENDVLLTSSFGPRPLQLVRSLRDQSCPRKIRAFNERHDVWSQSLKNGAATFGGNGWIAHATKAGDRFTYQKPTKQSSHVLSLAALDRDNVYAGHRSGDVVHYDFRVPFRNMLFKRETPVAKLRKIDSVVGGLVVAGLRNELCVYDVRFASEPAYHLTGHRNSHHLNLALSASADDHLIVAGGSDCHVRAWSAATGDQVAAATKNGPLDKTFDAPVRGIAWCGDDLLIGNGASVDVFSREGASGWKWDIT